MYFTFNGQLKGEKFFWRVFLLFLLFLHEFFRQFSLFFFQSLSILPWHSKHQTRIFSQNFLFRLHRIPFAPWLISETSKLQKCLRGSLTPDVTSRVLEMKEKLWLAGKFPVLDYSSNLWAAAAFWYLIGFHSQNFSGVWFLWTHFSFLGPFFF